MQQKILIVEDDPANREMLMTVLRNEGCAVICAEDGRAGLALAEAQRPHLILTDISMPNLDGIEMIKSLRANPDLSDIPIIVCTAQASGVTVADALSAGANYAIYKPIRLKPLLAIITQLLSV